MMGYNEKRPRLNLHFYPSNFKNESKVEKESRTILKNGFADVVHLVGKGKNGDRKLSEDILIKLIGSENVKSNILIKIIRFSLYYIISLYTYLSKNVVLVNVHSLSVLPLGYIFKVFKGSILIYDTHELETETNGLHGIRKKIVKKVERFFISYADHVFVVSENIADWYKHEYNISRPTVLFNSPVFKKVDQSNYFRKKYKLTKDQIIVLYQGNLVSGRGLEWLIETFEQRKNNKFVLVIMGYGILESKIKVVSTSHSLIYFHPAVPPNELIGYTASADIGISLIQNTCLSYYYCMPNKLFEYMMAGLPVIVSNMKEMREFVERNEVGVVIEEETVKGLNMVLENYDNNFWKGFKNKTKLVSSNYSWYRQELKMVDVYKNLFQ